MPHFNVNSVMNAIWLTIVASCVVNEFTTSTVGLVHDAPNANEIIAENAHKNNDFDMMILQIYDLLRCTLF